jgi:hypothetical protein
VFSPALHLLVEFDRLGGESESQEEVHLLLEGKLRIERFECVQDFRLDVGLS